MLLAGGWNVLMSFIYAFYFGTVNSPFLTLGMLLLTVVLALVVINAMFSRSPRPMRILVFISVALLLLNILVSYENAFNIVILGGSFISIVSDATIAYLWIHILSFIGLLIIWKIDGKKQVR